MSRDAVIDFREGVATVGAALARVVTMLLLADLEQLHLHASRASLAWVALAQAAQAAKDAELLSIASDCHPETLRTLRWTTQKVKDSAPQALAAG